MIGNDAWSDEPAFAGTHVTGVCGSGIIEAIAELHLAGILTTDGTIDGALAARSPRIVTDGRTFSYVLSDGEPLLTDHAERHPPDPAREGRPPRGLHAALRALRDRPRRPHPARRRVRQPHRPRPRARARPRPRLRPRQRHLRRQRRRHRRPDRAARPLRARRDRGGRAAGREDRDRRRAALPGALRRRDGDSARHRPLRAAARGRHAAAAPRRRSEPRAASGRRGAQSDPVERSPA